MAQWSVTSARVVEETPERLVVAPAPSVRRARLWLIGLLLLFGVGGLVFGLLGAVVGLAAGSATVCLLPALVLLFVVPLACVVTVDSQAQRVNLRKKRLLELDRVPQPRERNLSFFEITSLTHKADLLGNAHRVEMETSDGDRILLHFGRDEVESRRVSEVIAGMLGPEAAPRLTTERLEEATPAATTGWRLGLSALYGLVTALLMGYLWYLLATVTGWKLGLAALVLGMGAGLVVSFFGGGSRDVRYSLLGAALSGVGIAAGEFLIYGLPDSRFVFDLDAVDLTIYGLAVFEGWVIPRRSVPLVRRGSHRIGEHNRTLVTGIGIAALVVLLGLAAVTGRLPSSQASQAKAHYDRATLLAEQGRTGEALAEYQEAIRLEPDFALAHNDLGYEYYAMGQLAQAEDEFEKALQADPKLAVAHANLANVYDDQGRYDEGLAVVEEALHLDPSLAYAHLVSAYLYVSLGRLGEAQASLEKSIELDSSLVDAHLMLGLIHYDQANYALAIECLDNALAEQSPNETKSVIYTWRGIALGTQADYEGALADLDRAIKMDSENAFAYHVRGLVCVEVGERERAISDLEQALELGLDPDLTAEAQAVLADLRR
jgi:tetratricopeptide (TPR) repeat protein